MTSKPKGIQDAHVTRCNQYEGGKKDEATKRANAAKKNPVVPKDSAKGSDVKKKVLSGEVVEKKKLPAKSNRSTRVIEGKATGTEVSKPSQKRLAGPKSSLASKAKGAARGALGRAAIGVGIADAVISAHKASGVGDYPKGKANTDSTGKSTKISMTKKQSSAPAKKAEAPKKAPKKSGVSSTRKAFNSEFRKQRASGAKEFTFRGKRYNTKIK